MMKKFTIIEEKLIGFENGISMKVVEIMSDTESDIPEPQPEWAVGSIAYAIDTGNFCILNSSGEWVNQDDYAKLSV